DGGNVTGAKSYAKGSKATFMANPHKGWEFLKWSGNSESNESTINIIIDAKKTLTAHFRKKDEVVLEFNVKVVLDPPEGGYVSGIGSYKQDDMAILSASASEGWTFKEWCGDINSIQYKIQFNVDANKHLTARFQCEVKAQETTFNVSVKADPPEAGNVIGGGTCSIGQSWSIQAIPTNGWQFAEWTGDISGKENPLRLVVDSSKIITGKFIRHKKVVLKQSSNPPEAGVPIIEKYYSLDSMVKITARASDPTQWVFEYWSGDLSGCANPISLTMNTDKQVIANYFKSNLWGEKQEFDEIVIDSKIPKDLGRVFAESIENTGKKQNRYDRGKPQGGDLKPKIGSAFDQTSDEKVQGPDKCKKKEKKDSLLGGAFK
ncbi:MAG: InlB B-repeat-containing protein, partial [Mobilitalea sp.]